MKKLLILALVFISCRKDKPTQPQPVRDTAFIRIYNPN